MGLLQRRLGANLIRVYFWSGKAVGQIGSRHAQDTQVMAPSRRKHAHENTQNTFIIIGFLLYIMSFQFKSASEPIKLTFNIATQFIRFL